MPIRMPTNPPISEIRTLPSEIAPDFRVGGAYCLAHADLPNARVHRGQHDVHDADAAHQQRQHGNQQQYSGQCIGDLAGNREQLRQVFDLVYRLRPVP